MQTKLPLVGGGGAAADAQPSRRGVKVGILLFALVMGALAVYGTRSPNGQPSSTKDDIGLEVNTYDVQLESEESKNRQKIEGKGDEHVEIEHDQVGKDHARGAANEGELHEKK
jgi:hypothetical protein